VISADGERASRDRRRLQCSTAKADTSIVVYFYEKQQALLQCEVLDTSVPDTYAIILTETDGRVRTHYVKGSNDVHRLWLALEQQLRSTGWNGPVGQDLNVR
jgi:hypothetical protein